ncbi:MAG TPA: spore germination protein, partial [Desulfobacteria bacterium]|nr:spore germination protein [Desulfobacteria bacterium]
MLPTPLLISIMAAREGVPFPTAIEVAVIEFTFEALREAGVRLPKPVGQAVSIVGALVIGQAAVEAGFISPATVIVVAVTAISSFCVPNYGFAFAVRILRFTMILLAAILGFYGIVLALLLMQLHLVSLRSFGVPYFAPLAPFNLRDFKDVFIRAPWWNMQNRPRSFWSANRDRQKPDLKPKTPDKDR